jgi:hypothetical protein
MPISDLIRVHEPSMTTYRHAFSTEFGLFSRDELQSVDRRYGHCAWATMGALYDLEGSIIESSVRDGGRSGDLVVDLDPPRLIEGLGPEKPAYLRGRRNPKPRS